MASSCVHADRHLQPLCPGAPTAAPWYYCHGSIYICLTKLEMGKWNPEILNLKLWQDQSRINKIL